MNTPKIYVFQDLTRSIKPTAAVARTGQSFAPQAVFNNVANNNNKFVVLPRFIPAQRVVVLKPGISQVSIPAKPLYAHLMPPTLSKQFDQAARGTNNVQENVASGRQVIHRSFVRPSTVRSSVSSQPQLPAPVVLPMQQKITVVVQPYSDSNSSNKSTCQVSKESYAKKPQ